jgi:hypothetical protein
MQALFSVLMLAAAKKLLWRFDGHCVKFANEG